MDKYFHSVGLNVEKCKGCTNCIKRCPTDAIRVTNGKAKIMDERCIDCGECIRACSYHAKIAYTDSLALMNKYEHKIVLPPPVLYGQIKNLTNPSVLRQALLNLGFDYVYDVAKAAEVVSFAVSKQVINTVDKRPLISSACPAIARLIAVRFPELIDNIVPVESPMEVAAVLAKEEYAKKIGCDISSIGAFFITPCPAKMTSVRAPLSRDESHVDGVFSILDIYGLLQNQVKNIENNLEQDEISSYGLGWANSGGEARAVNAAMYTKSQPPLKRLAVDGVHNVIKALEEIENNKLTDLEFFEGLACVGGCVGGSLVFENSYVANSRITTICEILQKQSLQDEDINPFIQRGITDIAKQIEYKEVMKLDDDFIEAMRKMERAEKIASSLPGLDCGYCGCPTCRTLAEDIVRGTASELDCIVVLKDRVRSLAGQMEELLNKI